MKIIKKIFYIIAFFCAILAISCSANIEDSKESAPRTVRAASTLPEIPADKATVPANTLRIYFDETSAAFMHMWNLPDGTKTPLKKVSNWNDAIANQAHRYTWSYNHTYTDDAGASQTRNFIVMDVEMDAPKETWSGRIGFIPRTSDPDGRKLTGDCAYTLETGVDTIYLRYNRASESTCSVFYDAEFKRPMKALSSAYVTTADGNTIELYCEGYDSTSLTSSTVTVKHGVTATEAGTALTVSTVVLSDGNKKATITITGGDLDKLPYTVSVGGKSITADKSGEVDADVLDTKYDATAVTDLGLTITSSGIATFKTWAPTAKSVSILLFADAASCGVKGKDIGYGRWATAPTNPEATDATKVIAMEKDETGTPPTWNGVWKKAGVNFGTNKYYKYRITFAGTPDKVYDIADIHSFVNVPDSSASQLISIDDTSAKPDGGWETSYTNPFGSNGADTKKYSDAVIYEMHISDWSGCTSGNSAGSFEGFVSDENINHLKDLGITHVQILPMFDYATTNADDRYNWGYDPYHYNVPESRYSSATDGAGVVKSMRTMIKKLHEAGISVLMDVVYNHTSGIGEYSLYDMTVPKYFYRINNDGTYSNGSGCGNEVATNHKMVKKYVLDSLKHWMNDYHINGFRFDLMGLHEVETMNDFYTELAKIDKNIIINGEPWTGGDSIVVNGVSKVPSGSKFAAFDDNFRDAVKGGVFTRIEKGFVQGDWGHGDGGTLNYWREDKILKLLEGKDNDSVIGNGSRNVSGDSQYSIRYTEIHDNSTLFDKLVLSNGGLSKDTDHGKDYKAEIERILRLEPPAEAKTAGFTTMTKYIEAQDKLCAALTILAQGTPDLSSGQEFMRSKQGNDNSYGGEQGVTTATYWAENKIDLARKVEFADVYNTYRGLIALRRDNPNDFSNISTDVSATVVNDANSAPIHGFIKYKTTNFVTYINATCSEQTISQDNEGYVVDITGGAKLQGYTGIVSHSAKVSLNKYYKSGERTTTTKVPALSFVIIKTSN